MNKKVYLYLPLWAWIIPLAVQAADLGALTGLLNQGKGQATNIAVGILNNSSITAEAEASHGGMAAAGGVVADQNTKNKAVSTNISVGILSNTAVTARAKASGKNSKALAGGIIAGAE